MKVLLMGVCAVALGAVYAFNAPALMSWSRKLPWNRNRAHALPVSEWVIWCRVIGAVCIAAGAIWLTVWLHARFKL